MCGIVGIIGKNTAVSGVLAGLKALEYRGYDSAGIAAQAADGSVNATKAVGKIAALEEALQQSGLLTQPNTVSAIGHTRWATHGKATQANAHPHTVGPVSVVHNGIIENYAELREQLQAVGISFQSETDTETVPAFIAHQLSQGKTVLQAINAFSAIAEGAFALGILVEGTENETPTLYATRRGAPLVVGLGEEGVAEPANYIGSDPLALAGHTNRFIFLEDDDIAVCTPRAVQVLRPNAEGADPTPTTRESQTLNLEEATTGKGGYRHFMLKEMHEQPAVVSQLLAAYLPDGALDLPQLPIAWADVPQVNIVACGTAYYSACVAKYYFEQLAGIPVNVDVASEFRYRQPPFVPNGLFIAISQSGETADTLAALEHAKANGQHSVAVTNTPTSSIARTADVVMNLHAGPEIAVASTKAFMAMLVAQLLLALQAAHSKGKDITAETQALKTLPIKLEEALNSTADIAAFAKQLQHAGSMLYLGRGALQPLAYEGALKMKEITYIHAEAYASGEMKHGPIALVDETLPVVNLASSTDGLLDKTVSNMKEVEARNGQVILICDKPAESALDTDVRESATILHVPTSHAVVAPMVFSVPLQQLAYFTAMAKGTDVDQPRNLAKSVTVE